MSIVHIPLSRAEPAESRRGGPTARAMAIGQHVMAVLLTTIGISRAIGDGVSWPAAAISGVAILAWHTAGLILAARTRPRRMAVWWLLGFAAIWIAAVAISAEFIWLAFLLWLLAGHLLPLPWGLAFSGFVLAVVVLAPLHHHGTTTYANILGPLIGGVFAFAISRGYLQLLRDAAERARLVASLTRAQDDLVQVQDELALAQRHSGAIAERGRISGDIHDTIAQGLSSILLLAHAGVARIRDPDAARTLTQIEALAGDSLADVRRIVAALAPWQLEDDALAAALQRLLDRARDEAHLTVELSVDTTLPSLPTDVEVALLRTAQSALSNVRRHAGATRVVMSLIDSEDTVRLDIIDDGIGFTPPAWEGAAEATSSYGLRIMRSRLRELGGGLEIESSHGGGTAISAYLPIHRDGTPHARRDAETIRKP